MDSPEHTYPHPLPDIEFGNRDRFAIATMVPWRAGAYWTAPFHLMVGGTRFGDVGGAEVLGAMTCDLEHFTRSPFPDAPAIVFNLPRDEVLAHAARVRGLIDVPEEERALAELVDRCSICPFGGETFDDYYAILLEHGDTARLIWRDRREDVTGETRLARGEYSQVVRECCTWARQATKDYS